MTVDFRDGRVYGLGHIVDIVLIEAAHIDASRLQQIHMEFIDEHAHLFLCKIFGNVK